MRIFRLKQSSNCNSRSDASRFQKVLSLFAAIAILISCFAATGCDLGTYNQRLNEKPVAPVEEPAEDASGTDDAGGEEAKDTDVRGE